jgi:hypothetical protein
VYGTAAPNPRAFAYADRQRPSVPLTTIWDFSAAVKRQKTIDAPPLAAFVTSKDMLTSMSPSLSSRAQCAAHVPDELKSRRELSAAVDAPPLTPSVQAPPIATVLSGATIVHVPAALTIVILNAASGTAIASTSSALSPARAVADHPSETVSAIETELAPGKLQLVNVTGSSASRTAPPSSSYLFLGAAGTDPLEVDCVHAIVPIGVAKLAVALIESTTLKTASAGVTVVPAASAAPDPVHTVQNAINACDAIKLRAHDADIFSPGSRLRRRSPSRLFRS